MSSEGSGKNDVKVDVSLQADFKPVLESAPSGFKRVFQVLFGGRHARIERHTRLTEAQTDVDIQRILRGEVQYDPLQNGFVQVDTSHISGFIRQDTDDEETSNLLACSMHAAVTIDEADNALEKDEISRDFILKWRNEAKFISNETAQAIWGRILAEEIKDPGSISSRSLDIIKNLSKSEAITFNKACSFVAFERYLVDNAKGDPLTSEEFTALRDAGLITSYTPGLYRGTTWPDTAITTENGDQFTAYFVRMNKFFIFKVKPETPSPEAPSFSYWELTQPAKELYKIISPTIEDNIEIIAKSLEKGTTTTGLRYTTYLDVEKNIIDTNNFRDI